jgi:hypothetical protein
LAFLLPGNDSQSGTLRVSGYLTGQAIEHEVTGCRSCAGSSYYLALDESAALLLDASRVTVIEAG